jgi:alpha-mannosidase
MASALQRGSVRGADLLAEWRVYAGEPMVELMLRVHWRAARRLLKLTMPIKLAARTDGVMGGALPRDLDRRERPIQDFTWLRLADGRALGIVCPDVFALDGDADGVRLTLLRSPLMAHHDPSPAADFPRAVCTDQGVHEFRFQFTAFDGLIPDELARRAAMLHRPPIMADWTKGMTARGDW